MSVRIGLVGYGLGGRIFHTPFIRAADNCELVGVVTRDPDRVRQAMSDLPGITVHASLSELIASGVDAVVLSTPLATRESLVLDAVARGVHVVVDKPFAPTAELGQEFADAAQRAGVVLSVFHNRRWDTDVVTLRRVLESGSIGRPWRFESRLDSHDPASLDPGPSGGLLRDLGSHLVDRAIVLMGPVRHVSAQVEGVDLGGGRTEAGFVVSLEHVDGANSHVSASRASHLVSRQMRVLGDAGSYESDFSDVQVDDVLAGRRPEGDRRGWGFEHAERWGRLSTVDGVRTVPSAQGDYTLFYEAFARAITEGTPPPVLPSEAVAVLRVLDAARTSALEHRTVTLG